jgi:hypothetical protein
LFFGGIGGVYLGIEIGGTKLQLSAGSGAGGSLVGLERRSVLMSVVEWKEGA